MGGARLGVNGNNVSSVTWFLSLLGLAELCPFSGYLTQPSSRKFPFYGSSLIVL